MWRALYGPEPEAAEPYSAAWAEIGGRERLAEAARRHLVPITGRDIRSGDVLLFRWRAHLPAKHAAILSGPTTMIHAHDGLAVCEVHFTAWWQRRLACAFRFPEEKE